MDAKQYLNNEDFEILLNERKKEYENNEIIKQEVKKLTETIDRGIMLLTKYQKENKIQVFNKIIEGKYSTFIEIDKGLINSDEIETLNKVASFFIKIDNKLGYN